MKPARAVLILALAACTGDAGVRPAAPDSVAAVDTAATSQWPDSGSVVNLRRERDVDLRGDSTAERLSVTARGARYDSLDIALTITGSARDTLWHAEWSSRHYFKYDTLEGKADSVVMRIVRAHVDSLLADSRFTARGLAPQLSQGDRTEESQREAVRYHLAELDWRGGADLTPADELPPSAHSRIDVNTIAAERVDVVIAELRDRPVFWYYAGGEETYAIAWSAREHAFVRLYSCC